MSLREIADNSKISLRYLEALEQDRFDVLPAPVFARGFLREYARVVGLNPDEVVNLFLLALEERKGADVRVEAHRQPGRKPGPSTVGYGLLLILAVVAFLAVAAFLSFYAERRRGPAPVSEHVAPLAPPESREATATAGSADASRDASAAATTVPGLGTAGAPAVPDPLRVVLNFVQDCWIETVVDGRRRTSELRAAGETMSLEADESVVLTLGNAAAVLVEVNGSPFALPANTSRVVRDLRIERPSAVPSAARP